MKAKFLTIIFLSILAVFGLQAKVVANATMGEDDYAQEQGTVVLYEGKQYIRVTDARQFLRSFISGKNILVSGQTEINLTPLLQDKEWWQKNNYYFKWLPCYESEKLTGQNIVSEEVTDGRQLAIVGFKDINIVGEGNSRIVVEPRYAFCLNFVNCQNITISNLTIGHTEAGHCEGGVIGVTGGKGISICNGNLYGCGTYGLELRNTQDFSMYDSGIHDCTYGIMWLEGVESALFERCNFFRNEEFSLIKSRKSDITFNSCNFYANKSTSPLFDIDREFRLNDCVVLHPAEYLGLIDFAKQEGNLFDDNTCATEYIGFDSDPFVRAGHGQEKVLVNYKGSKPTIVDFINAVVGYWDTYEDDGCEGWEEVWKNYQLTQRPDEGRTIIVDERNGYVRMETKYDGYVVFYEFCYWNCADGKHKLFAQNNSILENGKAVETECTALYFYLYDNATNRIEFMGSENEAFGGRPEEVTQIAYLLPRAGKDITYIDANGKRGTMSFNGNGFGLMKPVLAMPRSAQRMDAKGQYAVYVNQESEEESSIWLVDEKNQTVERVCVTESHTAGQWKRMRKLESDAAKLSLDCIASAQKAWVCPEAGRRIIVEGCPDSRNIFTYIIDVDTHCAWQLPSNEGVVAIDGKKNEIIAASYGYDDDGRYSYNRAYSFEGKFLRMVGDKERE